MGVERSLGDNIHDQCYTHIKTSLKLYVWRTLESSHKLQLARLSSNEELEIADVPGTTIPFYVLCRMSENYDVLLTI